MLEKLLQEMDHRCYDHIRPTPNPHVYTCGVCNETRTTSAKKDECCGPIVCDSKEGTFVCSVCGKVLDSYMYEGCGFLNNQFIKDRPPQKKRHYHSGIHFQTHLKRYMGASPGEIPDKLYEQLGDIDLKDRNAYFEVRRRLKSLKLSKYYKHIFRIIYDLGGRKPELSGDQLQRLNIHFNMMQSYFYENSGCFMGHNSFGDIVKYRASQGKFSRKSMPSISMLLDFLLKGVGHTPFYSLPYLKDKQLRHRVYEFYNSHITNLEECSKFVEGNSN